MSKNTTKIIYKIKTPENKIYYFHSLEKFCKKYNLTVRLLRYTNPKEKERHKNNPKIRYQETHKGYKILGEYEGTYCKVKDSKQPCIFIWDLIDYMSLSPHKNNLKEQKKKEEKILCENYQKEKIEESNTSEDTFLIKEIQSLIKKLQNERDKNTLLRKTAREQARKDLQIESFKNFVIEEIKSYHNRIQNKEIQQTPINIKSNKAILCLSDIHIGKKVSLKDNQYNLDIATNRLMQLFLLVLQEINTNKVDELNICLLGDLIHAQYRNDMKATSEFLEIESAVQCYGLLKYFLELLREAKPKLRINLYYVVGNESRFSNDVPHTNIKSIAKNSLDYLIYIMLQESFVNDVNMEFLTKNADFDDMIKVGDKNIAILHGDKLNHSKLDSEVPKLKLKLLNKYGVVPDYIFMGHIHSSIVTDFYARNSSLVGMDDYAQVGLNIPESTVSQLFSIVSPSTNRLKVYSLKLN